MLTTSADRDPTKIHIRMHLADMEYCELVWTPERATLFLGELAEQIVRAQQAKSRSLQPQPS